MQLLVGDTLLVAAVAKGIDPTKTCDGTLDFAARAVALTASKQALHMDLQDQGKIASAASQMKVLRDGAEQRAAAAVLEKSPGG